MPTKKVSWATGKINKNSRRRRREGATNDVLFLTNCGRWDEGRARTMVKATTMLIVLSLYGYLLFVSYNYRSRSAPRCLHTMLDTLAFHVVDLPNHGQIPRPTLRVLGLIYATLASFVVVLCPYYYLFCYHPPTRKIVRTGSGSVAPKYSAQKMKLFEVRELYDNEEDARNRTGTPLKRWVY